MNYKFNSNIKNLRHDRCSELRLWEKSSFLKPAGKSLQNVGKDCSKWLNWDSTIKNNTVITI